MQPGMIFFCMCVIFIVNTPTIYGVLFGFLQFAIIFLFIFALVGKILKSVNFASIILLCLFFMSRIQEHYIKKPLLLTDLFVLKKVENWHTILEYKELIFVIAIYLFAILFAIFAYSKAKKFSPYFRISSVFVLLLFCSLHQSLIANQNIREAWFETFPYLTDTFFNFSMSLRSIAYKSPDFKSDFIYFEEESSQIPDYETSNVKPNLILWLSESTIDASVFQGNLPALSMFRQHENTKFNSLVRVHTFGGYTYKSEFEVLTGLSPDDFGLFSPLLFYSVAEHIKYSLPKILKQHGYKTIVLNPFVPAVYNAGAAYKHLGFDEQYHPTDLGYGGKRTNLWDIASLDMANLVKKLLAEAKEPVFIYVLSMNEHGPYDKAKSAEFGLDKFYDRKKALHLTDYYKRQILLNTAIESLDKYLQESKKDYVFAYFGDHQGDLGLEENEFAFHYKNPFNITNFVARGSKNIKKIEGSSLSELGLMPGVLLELMQISPNESFRAGYAMRKLCANNGGGIDDCSDEHLVKSYKSYLFDKLGVADN